MSSGDRSVSDCSGAANPVEAKPDPTPVDRPGRTRIAPIPRGVDVRGYRVANRATEPCQGFAGADLALAQGGGEAGKIPFRPGVAHAHAVGGRSGLRLDRETERQLERMTRQVEAAERARCPSLPPCAVELKNATSPRRSSSKTAGSRSRYRSMSSSSLADHSRMAGGVGAETDETVRPEPLQTLRAQAHRVEAPEQRPSLATRWRLCRRPST